MLERKVQEAREESGRIAYDTFEQETLFDCDMSQLLFHSVQFIRCGFAHCDFSQVEMEKVKFINCDFSGCHFSDSFWKKCQIQDCKGDRADFSGSLFRETILTGNSFCYTNFHRCRWQDSALMRCLFKEGVMTENQFRRIKLKQVNFTRADFFRTMLDGIDLSECAIVGIGVSDSFAELHGAKIDPTQAVDLVPLLGVKLI